MEDYFTYGIWWDESCVESQSQRIPPARVWCYKTWVLGSRDTGPWDPELKEDTHRCCIGRKEMRKLEVCETLERGDCRT